MEVQKIPQPECCSRVETGVVQFGNDWPGVFLRGDNAQAIALRLKYLLEKDTEKDFGNELMNGSLTEFLGLLLACKV
jgi:hypothetical protein